MMMSPNFNNSKEREEGKEREFLEELKGIEELLRSEDTGRITIEFEVGNENRK